MAEFNAKVAELPLEQRGVIYDAFIMRLAAATPDGGTLPALLLEMFDDAEELRCPKVDIPLPDKAYAYARCSGGILDNVRVGRKLERVVEAVKARNLPIGRFGGDNYRFAEQGIALSDGRYGLPVLFGIVS